jgi:hypothetical protein
MRINKKTLLILVSSIFLFSCNNGGALSEKDNVSIAEFAAQKKTITNMPSGYTSTAYVEYVAKNEEESHFLHDMKEMLSARQNKDCEKIVELYYPDYIKLIQKEVPEKSEDEIKKILVSYLDENVNEMNAAFINQWEDAITAGMCITDIKNVVRENKGILFLYEYHNTLISETDTIFKEEAEYSVAASLDNGKTWYAISPEGGDWNQIFKLLEIRFSHRAIDEVLTER